MSISLISAEDVTVALAEVGEPPRLLPGHRFARGKHRNDEKQERQEHPFQALFWHLKFLVTLHAAGVLWLCIFSYITIPCCAAALQVSLGVRYRLD